MEYTNARHSNGAWVKMTSLIKDYLTVKRNDGKEYLQIRFTDHSKRKSVIQAIHQDKFKLYTICEDSLSGKYGQFIARSRIYTNGKEDYFYVSGFFILKDETRILSIDEHENCFKYDKDIIFLDDEFCCNEIVHAFDLEMTFLQNFNHEIKKKDMVGRGSTPFDRAYMNVSVFTQGNDPVPLGVICLLDTGTDTPLRYESEEKIKERIWKMVNDITKFQKVDSETIKTMEEHDFYRAFAKIQNNIKPHVIIGHNSNGFDMLFIMRKLEWLGSTMMEEFYRIATGKQMTYGEMFKYNVLQNENITLAQGEDAIEYTYINSLNYMLDTLEIPSKIGLSYRRIDEIVLLAIETAKIQDEITKLNIDSMDYHNKIEELNSRQSKVINNLHEEEGLKNFVQTSLNIASMIHGQSY
ncbi:9217_t:CDS:2 [Racocetra persica]|uniref:9217_t:CDS:1 n=1 Tax=Racocetra persica TaxID=160502 RepID=A0ACA9PU11_9GLOM|nr:9217_t:CDS:2 [Racocetra persica]